MKDEGEHGTAAPSFRTALGYWHRLGWISFGGPAGQIAIMQHELVERRRWIGQDSFLHALNFCMLLPGPEAQQLATYIGWRLHGWRGAVAAGSLFVLPGALVLWGLSWLIAAQGAAAPVAAVLDGIKPVVIAIIAHAVWRIGRRSLKGWPAVTLACAAFVAIFVLGVDFPWIVAVAATIGLVAARLGYSAFASPTHGATAALAAATAQGSVGLAWRRAAMLILLFAGLWGAGVGAVLALFGSAPFADVARLFTTAAFVTFGGAYAVLPFVADAAVNDYGWLGPGEMINGLALAETTPGPLILVLQYVGFLAGWNQPGTLPPLLAASVAAALTTYVTFLPSFMFILIGAPHVERLRHSPLIASALGAITAAVVGVIANLGVFLGQAVLLPPSGLDIGALVIALAAFAVLVRFGPGIHWLVLAGAVIGAARLGLGFN